MESKQRIYHFNREDISTAIQQLTIFGPSLQILTVKDKKYISSVPLELNEDDKKLIELGEKQGYISETMAKQALGFESQRFQGAIVTYL